MKEYKCNNCGRTFTSSKELKKVECPYCDTNSGDDIFDIATGLAIGSLLGDLFDNDSFSGGGFDSDFGGFDGGGGDFGGGDSDGSW